MVEQSPDRRFEQPGDCCSENPCTSRRILMEDDDVDSTWRRSARFHRGNHRRHRIRFTNGSATIG